MSATATVAICALSLLHGAESRLTTHEKPVFHDYHYRPAERTCISINYGAFNGYARIETPSSSTYIYPHDHSIQNLLPRTGDILLRDLYKLTILPTAPHWHPLNSIIISSCAAECEVTKKNGIASTYCHDPLVAPKCTSRSNNFTQSRNTNATMPKQYRNSNKIKSWRAKPKF